ncbi:MAG: putative Ig domain-containing protein, partial [Pseudomonadota bacterium]
GTFTVTPAANYNGTMNLSYDVIDGNGGSIAASQSYSVAAVNDAPEVLHNLLAQNAQQGEAFSYVVPGDTFTDPDGDTLVLSATLGNGQALPSWLVFNAATGTFSGTPAGGDVGSINVTVQAQDAGGLTTSSTFALNIISSDIYGTAGDDVLTGTSTSNNIYGLGGNDTLYGLGGNDLLDGGSGIDTMAGGAGNDTYVVDSISDVVVENAGEGTDTVVSSYTYTLSANVENLTLTGTAGINGTGNALDNVIIGNDGINTLAGGAGNDTYYVCIGDSVIENAGAGIDTVISCDSFTLSANIENLTLIADPGHNINTAGTGNNLANVIIGNVGNNVLNGMAGADTMVGGAGNDTYYVDNAGDLVYEVENEGNDTVYSSVSFTLDAGVENLILIGNDWINGTGNDLDNYIKGNMYGNTLNGGLGADTMEGGLSNDIYVVDNIGDTIIEYNNYGTADTVQSSIDYTLGTYLENLTLTGTANLNGNGNDSDNILTGNSGNNVLDGGVGNDTLNGGTGADTMIGGLGNDAYYVDNAGDLVIEAAGEGTDTVYSSVSFVLPDNVENLILTGTANITGTGNVLNNAITGNSGANALTGSSGNDTIDGGVGADTMTGGLGDDTYYVDNTGDVIVENAGEGIDTVYSTITYSLAGTELENLTLAGNANINATGNAYNNVITGNSGMNTINGGAGADTMSGGTGNDTYYVDDAGDVVIEGANGGTDTVYSSVSFVLPDNVENLILTGTANITGTGNVLNNTITGNSGANILTGSSGSDIINGGAGADIMTGGGGDDIYYVDNAGDVIVENANEGIDTVNSSVTFTLAGTELENLTLTGTAAINGTGNAYNNTITGNASANVLTGGAGDDIYYIGAGDTVVENANEGYDWVITSANYTVGANIEKVTLTGTALTLTGNGLDNALEGNDQYNIIDGGAGADIMSGGLGNDTYYVDNAGDVVIEGLNAGIDTVYSSVSFVLPDNVENLILTGSGNIAGTGNGLNNSLTGNSWDNILTGSTGNDTINGGVGADTMIGGLGDDIYYVDNAGDAIVENANEGIDTVNSSVTFTLAGTELENLTLTGTAAINGTGNAYNNTITGNSGANVLAGGAGNDTYYVDGLDTIVENVGEGIDTVYSTGSVSVAGAQVENVILTGNANVNATANELNNVITGNTGNNVIDGGAGADTMTGGKGNDTYVVDDAGDVINELAAEGTDTVQSYISYVLGSTLENLTLLGTADINGTGNGGDNILIGNSGANVLTGFTGNDTLDGGAGADTLIGAAGNDTYYVDNAGDVVVENANEGTDTAYSSVSYALTANVENLTLTGTANINGTGNELANILTGNNGANVLAGGLGNDTYYVDGSDTIVENAGEGSDTVYSSSTFTLSDNVENLVLTGIFNISATGNALNNSITGNSADNVINGGAGADTMTGGAGNDVYIVDNVGDVVIEAVGAGTFDEVQSSVSYTLSANVERLTLTGLANIDGTGNAMDNVITGNNGANMLSGLDGNDTIQGSLSSDILQGGIGNDVIGDFGGNNLLNGGAGNDTLNGSGQNEILIGGIGNDTINPNSGADIIAFNAGDGQDTVIAVAPIDNTLSLGGGITYQNLVFSKTGNNLVLGTGGTDQVILKDWYLGSTYRSVINLQVVLDLTSYNPASSDPLLSQRVQRFDFTALVAGFDQALAANPTMTNWNLTNALLSAHLAGSDTDAIGGDLAYRYATDGTLAAVGVNAAQSILNGAGFGSSAQALLPLTTLQVGTRLE